MAIPELRLKSLEDCKGITTFGRWKEVCPVAPQEPHGDRWEIVVIQWWEIVFWLEVDKHGSKWVNKDYGWKLAFQWISVG